MNAEDRDPREILDDLEDADLADLDLPRLEELLISLESAYARLEALEPDDEDSDEYLEWEEDLELMDDLMDGIRERMDDLGE